MKKTMYCILYDDDIKGFDIAGPIEDDTEFMMQVSEAARNGINIHCSTAWTSEVNSVQELKKNNDPPEYQYCEGLFEKHGISVLGRMH